MGVARGDVGGWARWGWQCGGRGLDAHWVLCVSDASLSSPPEVSTAPQVIKTVLGGKKKAPG